MEKTVPTQHERRERVAELHAQGLGCARIARALNAGKTTVLRDIRALGLEVHAPGAYHQKYPKPKPRVCDRDGCENVFTPTGVQVAGGYGRFCSLDCANKGKTYTRRTWVSGLVCPNCGRTFGQWRAVLANRPTKLSEDAFCTKECVGKYRWKPEHSETITPLVRTFAPRTRKVVFARLNAYKGGLASRGRKRKWAEDKRAERDMWNAIVTLHQSGKSYREIAGAVFGDRSKYKRVERFLKA